MKAFPNHSQPALRCAGFGLTELLTVIAVIGVIAALAIPALAGISDSANNRRCARIAQEYANLAAGANAAGCEALAAATSVAEALEMLTAGVAGSGIFADLEFKLDDICEGDRNRAAHHLELVNGQLLYEPDEPF